MKKKVMLITIVIAGAVALCYKSGICGKREATAE